MKFNQFIIHLNKVIDYFINLLTNYKLNSLNVLIPLYCLYSLLDTR